MAEEPDVIRGQIEETRSALTDKLETLEGQVRETVQSAKETVEDTIENVKSSVHETVESVKRTFDLKYQVEQHPWAMLGGSLVTGFLLGHFVPGRRPPSRGFPATEAFRGPAPDFGRSHSVPENYAGYDGPNGTRSAAPSTPAFAAEPSRPGLLSRLRHTFDDEIDKVKGMAVGAVLGIVRDLAKESFPQLAPQIEDVVNSATTKLGGQPVAGPFFEPSASRCQPDAWQ